MKTMLFDVNARLQAEREQNQAPLSPDQTLAELRRLACRLTQVEENERKRLSQELHDQVGQSITAISLDIALLRSMLEPETLQRMEGVLNEISELLSHVVTSIRDVMFELRPPVLDDYGLLAAIQWHAERYTQRTNIEVRIAGEDPNPRLPPEVEMALFRIYQEAMNNVAKHSQAQRVVVQLEVTTDLIRLSIQDNGVGFNLDDAKIGKGAKGWGLDIMRERAYAIGGVIRVDSAPGKGTCIRVKVGRQG